MRNADRCTDQSLVPCRYHGSHPVVSLGATACPGIHPYRSPHACCPDCHYLICECRETT